MVNKTQFSILFVCMGNICRSPTAEGVFRHLVTEGGLIDVIEIDSAGTHAYHKGEPPDRRAQEAAMRRGFDLGTQSARPVEDLDFERFDLILAMDRLNLETLRDRSEAIHHGKLKLMLEFAPQQSLVDVPDPYYGGSSGFERVLDLVEEAAGGLLEHLRRELTLRR